MVDLRRLQIVLLPNIPRLVVGITILLCWQLGVKGETDNSNTSGEFVIDVRPKPGDPWTGIIIEEHTGDIVLVKGFYRDSIWPGDKIEVMRLTHDGFVVVGKREIHIDALAAVIERLAIKYGQK